MVSNPIASAAHHVELCVIHCQFLVSWPILCRFFPGDNDESDPIAATFAKYSSLSALCFCAVITASTTCAHVSAHFSSLRTMKVAIPEETFPSSVRVEMITGRTY